MRVEELIIGRRHIFRLAWGLIAPAIALFAFQGPLYAQLTQEEQVRQVVEDQMENRAYQKSLPYSQTFSENGTSRQDSAPEQSDSQKNDKSLDDVIPPREETETDQDRSGWVLSGGLQALLWGVLALACGLIVANIIRAYRPGAAPPSEKPPAKVRETPSRTAKASASEKAKTVGVLGQADQLAERGAYGDAVQLLLTLCVERVNGQFSSHMLASLTNREILERAELSQEAKQAFSTIVSAEELSQFGRRQANQKIYTLCREHFDVFDRTSAGGSLGQ